MLRILTARSGQRIAVVRNGRFLRLLGPGRHLVWTFGLVVELTVYDLEKGIERVAPLDPIPEDHPGQRLVRVAQTERAIVRRDGVVIDIVQDGVFRVWEAAGRIEITVVDALARPTALDPGDRLPAVVAPSVLELSAGPGQDVVLLRDGLPVEVLPEGRYRAFRGSPWGLRAVSRQLQVLEPAAQDLVTRDEVPVRVKAIAAYRVADPVVALREPEGGAQLYAAVQRALREIVAARTLAELTEQREALSTALRDRVRALVPPVGLAVEEAFVKDVILPAEVKALVQRVTLARKEAEAQAITRREEVAATRQLANTAKLLEKSPILLRLKELEAMGQIVQRIDKLVVVGGADLARQISLKAIDE